MSPTLKRIAIALAALLLLAVLGIAALLVYLMLGESQANERATQLCAEATATANASGSRLTERAITLGAPAAGTRWHRNDDGSEQLLAVYPGRMPRSGYVCLITARAGRVVSAEVSAAD